MRLDFSGRVIAWQKLHGRHSLPWQNTRDPYRVWLSEIMLQQTQVTTVLGYYARFLDKFPDVQALAAATLDEVFALWSGLGYYSRARNMHRCAQAVVAEHQGAFPDNSAWPSWTATSSVCSHACWVLMVTWPWPRRSAPCGHKPPSCCR
jgi:A/G-specific adenine glycosylase